MASWMVPTHRKDVAGVGKEEEAAVSSEEEKNKALVRRFLEAHAKGDLGAMEEMLAPDFVNPTSFPAKSPSAKLARATCSQPPSIMVPSPEAATSSRSSWPNEARWSPASA